MVSQPKQRIKFLERKNMKLVKLGRGCIAAFALIIAIPSYATQLAPAFEFDTPTFSAKFGDYDLGIDFRVEQTLIVDALAYFNDDPSVAAHNIALFTINGAKLAETVVDTTDTLLGNFRYSSINPITLFAGNTYRLIGNSTGDNYTFGVQQFTVNPLITYLGYSYSATTGNNAVFDAGATTGSDIENAVWGPNLSVRLAPVQVPEPQSALLLTLGIAALAIARKKAQ